MRITQIDNSLFQNIKTSWESEIKANDELPDAAYERALSWISDVLEGRSCAPNVTIWAVLNEAGDVQATFDLVHARPHIQGGFFKILNIVTSPSLDLAAIDDIDQDEEKLREIIICTSKVIAAIMEHGLGLLASAEKAKKVKYFASGGVTLRVLKNAFAAIEDDEQLRGIGFKVNTYGNWAEFVRASTN